VLCTFTFYNYRTNGQGLKKDLNEEAGPQPHLVMTDLYMEQKAVPKFCYFV